MSRRTNRRTIVAAAAKGAELLDRIHPKWYKEINISALDLSDGAYCIIGQLNSGYFTPEDYVEGQMRDNLTAQAETQLRAAAKKINIPGFKSCEVGFDLDACLDSAVRSGLKGFNEYDYGFNLSNSFDDEVFSILTEAWVEQIRSRRSKR